MTNKKYIKGYMAELEAKKQLENQDFFVVRSAGSHSPVDLIAIDINHIKLIQVKSVKKGGYGDIRQRTDCKQLEIIPCPENCRKEIWIKFRNKKLFEKRVLDDD